MRIACLHLPAFPLQVVMRAELFRRGDAIAVVSASARTGMMPVVAACSRAARAGGVTIGMAATSARELAPGLAMVTADAAAERAAVKAIAEALRGISPRVDSGGAPVGPHHAIYCEVPARTRGAAFGARIHELCEVMGVWGRVGIADDRFTAHVAATSAAADGDGDGVVSIPRGGSAAFLAPMSLSVLALGGEVRHMLETLGVHTLGEFAALPPPSVARPEDADWQALARGDGGAALCAFVPSGAISERIAIGLGTGLGAAVGAVAARIAARLRGRGEAAAAIELIVDHASAPVSPRVTDPIGAAVIAAPIVPDAPLAGAAELADAIGVAVSRVDDGAIAWIEARVRVAVDDGAVMDPVFAEASAPLSTVAPLELSTTGGTAAPPVTPIARNPHRRTRRGKERPRVVTAQAALFGARGR